MTTAFESMLDAAEAIVKERLARYVIAEKGDFEGHPFRGNQWEGRSGVGDIPHQVGGRAPKGGVIGPNGLFYPGGSFVGTTDMDKLEKRQRKAAQTYLDRKQEIEPYNYSKPPAIDQSSLYSVVSGHGAKYDRETKKFDIDSISKGHLDYLDSNFGKGTAQEVKNQIELFNNGERWYVNQNLAHLRGAIMEKSLSIAEKTIAQVTKPYGDQLTNSVYDVWNGNSDAIDLRRAHKALIREFAFQAYDEGLREGGIPESEMDDEDKAARGEAVFDWLANQLEYVNDFAKAVGEARKDKAKRPAILERIGMWVDSMRIIGEQGRAYALRNVKAKWYLGDRQNHTPDCVDLSKKAAHRVSWWTERGYTPPIHLGCGCRLADVKNGETIIGEKARREDRGEAGSGFVTGRQRRWFFASGHGSGTGSGASAGGAGAGPSKVKRSRLNRDESEFRHYAENDDAEVHGAFQPEYREWSHSLSSNEADAIKAYTNGGYDDMNGWLRNGGNPAEGARSSTKNRITELDKAIAKAPKMPEDTILYRGFGSYELHTAVKNGKLKKGATLTDKGYMSTSPQSLEARSFGLSKNDPVIYKIRAEKGTHGAYLGFDHINAGHSNEAEFLLPRNAKLVVVNAEMKAHGGARYAEIEVAYLAD